MYKLNSAINQALSQYIDFDRELVRVSQVTGKSVQELGSLVDEISSLAGSTGVASKELIQVSSTLAQAGLSAREAEQALKALALSANAPSFDNLNDTVEGSIALMRQFGIRANELESALGSINAVAAAFAVEASDLITAISRTGGVFASASRGVSEGTQALNEFIAVFTSVRATTRESAETIATGLRTIFTRIQRESTISALRELGVELRDVEGKFVGPYEAVRRLSEGLGQLDPRSQVFANIISASSIDCTFV
jgi:TP901 family phage tail tape measure protein